MPNSAHKLDRFKAVQRQASLSQNSVRLPIGVTLERGRVHEITGTSADGFAATVISKTTGPVIWIGRSRDVYSVYPPALSTFFDPTRLITTECISRNEVLWAAEQAMRSKGSDVVVVQLKQGPNLKESRRLQLAAEQGRTLGLILIEKSAQSSASQTRWRCNPVNGNSANDNGWVWEMTKNKNGKAGQWRVVWRENGYAACDVDMVSSAPA